MFQYRPYADSGGMTIDEQFIVSEIHRFHRSKRFCEMMEGERYYNGHHDILHKKRTAIGKDGKLTTLDNLPNNRIVDNQYRKMANQKVQYLLGQPFLLKSDVSSFLEAVRPYLQSKQFFRLLKSVGKDFVNCGIGWIYPHYDRRGAFVLSRIKPYEVIPFWADADHTELEAAIRTYQLTAYENRTEKIITKVEVFDEDGIHYFELTDGGQLVPEEPFHQPYFTMTGADGTETPYNWYKIPLVAFRFNEEESTLLTRCKAIQDSLNTIESQWQDKMEEDQHNTIMVLVNYDGTNLGEFRQNLATYGAVKVRSSDGVSGDVKTLQVEVNAENYKAVIEQFRKAIVENCMGYDAKDDRLGGNANEMNIKSMYSDIELSANDMETETLASMEELMWFVLCHIANTGGGDFDGTEYEIIFNRDIMISESDVISNIRNSVGILSTETLISQHPWVDCVESELKRLEQEDSSGLYGEKV